jgi:hypothetical protein
MNINQVLCHILYQRNISALGITAIMYLQEAIPEPLYLRYFYYNTIKPCATLGTGFLLSKNIYNSKYEENVVKIREEKNAVEIYFRDKCLLTADLKLLNLVYYYINKE